MNKTNLPNNLFFHLTGGALLFANKIRHAIKGYTDPRGFSSNNINRAITYDFTVVDSWLKYLKEYIGTEINLENKHILELGPGADLGIGAILLNKGALRYTALDTHNLISSTPHQLYETLLKHPKITEHYISHQELIHQIDCAQTTPDRIIYRVDPAFSIKTISPPVDLVVSQAAFEHFERTESVVRELSQIVKPEGKLVAEIDLQTHSRWIREHDPLNIYRYSNQWYSLFHFDGSPNRLRPFEYVQLFQDNGWEKVKIIPLTETSSEYLQHITPHLARRFQSDQNEMNILTCILLATKSKSV